MQGEAITFHPHVCACSCTITQVDRQHSTVSIPLRAQHTQMSTTFRAFTGPKLKNTWENDGIGWFDVALMRTLIYRNPLPPTLKRSCLGPLPRHRAVSVRSLHLWVCLSSIWWANSSFAVDGSIRIVGQCHEYKCKNWSAIRAVISGSATLFQKSSQGCIQPVNSCFYSTGQRKQLWNEALMGQINTKIRPGEWEKPQSRSAGGDLCSQYAIFNRGLLGINKFCAS